MKGWRDGKKNPKNQPTNQPVFRGLGKQGVKMNEHGLVARVIKARAQTGSGRAVLQDERRAQGWAAGTVTLSRQPFLLPCISLPVLWHFLTERPEQQTLWGCGVDSPGAGLKQKDCIIRAGSMWSRRDGRQGYLGTVLFSELFLSRARKLRVNTG